MRYPFLLCLLTNIAFADVIPPATTPLIEKEMSGGFVPEEMWGYSNKTSIYPNGQVFISFKPNQNASWEHQYVATLEEFVVNKLNHVVTNTEAGQLEFPGGPECTDTPIITYSANKSPDETIIFAKQIACKMGYLPIANSYALQTILDGFSAFDWLNVE